MAKSTPKKKVVSKKASPVPAPEPVPEVAQSNLPAISREEKMGLAAAVLAKGGKYKDAAIAAGVSHPTIKEWMKSPLFLAKYAEEQRLMFVQHRGQRVEQIRKMANLLYVTILRFMELAQTNPLTTKMTDVGALLREYRNFAELEMKSMGVPSIPDESMASTGQGVLLARMEKIVAEVRILPGGTQALAEMDKQIIDGIAEEVVLE